MNKNFVSLILVFVTTFCYSISAHANDSTRRIIYYVYGIIISAGDNKNVATDSEHNKTAKKINSEKVAMKLILANELSIILSPILEREMPAAEVSSCLEFIDSDIGKELFRIGSVTDSMRELELKSATTFSGEDSSKIQTFLYSGCVLKTLETLDFHNGKSIIKQNKEVLLCNLKFKTNREDFITIDSTAQCGKYSTDSPTTQSR